MRSPIIAVLFVAILLAAPPAGAQIASATVADDTYRATVTLPGGIATELSVRFDGAVGLEPAALGVTAQLVNPASTALLARLPNLQDFAIPAAFPVLISIAPPAGGGFAFEGVYEIELYTRNLHYAAGTPLRLFSAPSGGAFVDITERVTGGSYRPRGSGGHFSEFMIVADLRPLPTVIDAKFARLSALLQAHGAATAAPARTTLAQLLAHAQSTWLAADAAGAADALSDFEAAVADAAAAGQIPRVWRSAGDITNVDGELRAAARTLRFSLNQSANAL